MQTVSHSNFTTITTEGAILPADLLQRIVDGRELEGLKPTDYHLAPNERLNEAINRSWNRLLGVWESFDERRQNLPDHDRGTTLTREGWLLILLDELGYGRPTFVSSLSVDGANGPDEDAEAARYPISHEWQQLPLHLITFRQPLDKVDEDRGGRFRRSPHSLMQEFLNRSEQHLWGVVSNGLRLRILRDNVNFTRAAYLEFDLEAMMDGEIYADFTLLWLLAHQSRVEGEPETSWVEKWSQEAAEQGTRALDSLRDGVQNAISELGRGFLAHPANSSLRAKLQASDGPGQGLDKQDYYRQLLRLVYRLIFLFVAEERNLLLVEDIDAATRNRYYDHYSVTHLRELAERRRSGPHPDLYRTLRLVIDLLREGYPALGLPGLGSFLFSERSTPDLDDAEIANEALLKAIRALTFTIQDGVRRPVDYKNLGAEELGSVYESLLELHPELTVGAATFTLRTAAGSERKTTGSYYTPTSLINSLLETALEPAMVDRLRGKKGKEAEEALLSIRVVDPAAGSGHFLIAAANRLARELARIRTGDEEPSPQEQLLALRDVVRHCIHGVDLNEMAVELAKVALWMETMTPGRPLSFLDANIRQGNSLIGATPALLEEGIPDDAFKPVTGDDKEYAKEFKALNREQRRGQMALFKGGQPWQRLGNLAAALRDLERLEGDTLEGVRAQEEAYASLVRSQGYQYGKLWADAWCAAFFWPLLPEEEGGFPYPITEEEFRRIEHNPFSIPHWMRDEIERLAEQHDFFHWHLAFPHIFRLPDGPPTADETTGWEGGFDVVLGNPPWERIKLQEKEWFAKRSPEIAGAPRASIRRKMIKALEHDDPGLYKAFLVAKQHGEREVQFTRDSGRYPLCGRGDVNTYSVFAELSWSLIASHGRVGIVLPSGIATDSTTRYFFNELIQTRSLVSLYEFENAGFFTAGQGHMVRFALTSLVGRSDSDVTADYLFQGQELVELGNPERHFPLSADDIRLINPNTQTCPIFRTRRDAEITKAVYRRVPVMIDRNEAIDDSWEIVLRRMIHLSDDASLLRTQQELGEDGWKLEKSTFVKSDQKMVPVIEAKMVYQFNHRHGSFHDATPGKRPHRLPDIPLSDLMAPDFVVLPYYWISESEVDDRLRELWDRNWILGWRDVTDARASIRTVISAIIPRYAVTGYHQIFVYSDPVNVAMLCATLSSFALDFIARQKIGGIHLTYTILEQLPIIPPSVANSECPWNRKETVAFWILPHVLELTYTAYDLQPFARDVGYHGPPFYWDEERRFLLRCELDAAYFHLYGIARDDVAYIMDTFPIVRRKDEDEYGEYRTKRVILEIYDEMAEAERTGRSYQTRLDPPPAHPDAAHPWDEEYLGPELPREQWWQETEPAEPAVSKQPGTTYTSPPATSTVKEPAPAFELSSPQAPPATKQPQPEKPAPARQAQPALVTDFTPLQGSRSQRLKQVMALGDQVKSNRQDATVISQLVAALGDSDQSIRWLAGSALGLLGGSTVVQTLAAFLEQEEAPEAREEARKALQRIADNPREEEAVRKMAEKLLGE